MNPWDILAWAAAISLSVILVTLAVVVIVSLARSARPPRRGEDVYRGRSDS